MFRRVIETHLFRMFCVCQLSSVSVHGAHLNVEAVRGDISSPSVPDTARTCGNDCPCQLRRQRPAHSPRNISTDGQNDIDEEICSNAETEGYGCMAVRVKL